MDRPSHDCIVVFIIHVRVHVCSPCILLFVCGCACVGGSWCMRACM